MDQNTGLAARLWGAFHEGGWMMWFIFLFGLLTLAAAGRFALRGEYQLKAFIRWMTGTTLMSGAFAFGISMSKVLTAVVYRVAPNERVAVLLIGSKEALQNVNASLMFTTLAVLLVAIGHRRYPQPNASASL